MISEYRFWCSITKIRDHVWQKRHNNELDGNLVQGFRHLAKPIYLLNHNGKSDTFINVAGLFVHNSSINSAPTKTWILDSGAINDIASDSQFFTHFTIIYFKMLICPQTRLRSSHLRAQLNSMTRCSLRSFF